jgi:hypothetical protein
MCVPVYGTCLARQAVGIAHVAKETGVTREDAVSGHCCRRAIARLRAVATHSRQRRAPFPIFLPGRSGPSLLAPGSVAAMPAELGRAVTRRRRQCIKPAGDCRMGRVVGERRGARLDVIHRISITEFAREGRLGVFFFASDSRR